MRAEGDPDSYKALVRHRPAAVNINAALCNESRKLHFLRHIKLAAVNGFYEFMADSFLEKFHPTIFKNRARVNMLPTVQCLPLKKLLKMLKVEHIDIWVLDVEGAEESVLQGTDFNAVHMNVVAMECHGKDPDKDQRKAAILESNGFSCELVGRNCMCKHKDFTTNHTVPLL